MSTGSLVQAQAPQSASQCDGILSGSTCCTAGCGTCGGTGSCGTTHCCALQLTILTPLCGHLYVITLCYWYGDIQAVATVQEVVAVAQFSLHVAVARAATSAMPLCLFEHGCTPLISIATLSALCGVCQRNCSVHVSARKRVYCPLVIRLPCFSGAV
eukprot:10078-Heterococcus_DN1.PRE.1